MGSIDINSISQPVEQLFRGYCHCLDNRQFEQWPDFFTEECSYEVRQAEDHEKGYLVGLMVDSNRRRLIDRVKFMQEVWKGSIEDYRTRHFYQTTQIKPEQAGTIVAVESNFQVSYTPAESPSAPLVSGCYVDTIELDGDGGALFIKRSVILDGIPARALNYPL